MEIDEDRTVAADARSSNNNKSGMNDYREDFEHLTNMQEKLQDPQTALISKNWNASPGPDEQLVSKVPNMIVVSTGEDSRGNRSPVVTKVKRKPIRQDTEPLVNVMNQGSQYQQAILSLNL